MTTHLYAISWNEAPVIGFFLRHYVPFVDRLVIFDDGSTDGTCEILRNHPKVELRRFERSREDSLVLSMLGIYNECWKESRGKADWVIITNIDEHLHHPVLPDYLRHCQLKGVTVVPALGYQMISESFPDSAARLCEAVTTGAPSGDYSKLQIFNPDAVREINYTVGRHKAWPQGDVGWPERDELLNLHYQFLGRTYLGLRHGQLSSGRRGTDVQQGWGSHWLNDPPQLETEWQDYARRAVDISDATLKPWISHGEPRWWRQRGRDWLRSIMWRQRRRKAARRLANAVG